MHLSVIIPIYNEAQNIATLYNRVKQTVVDITASHEFIFINDGSKDNSMFLIHQLAEKDTAVKYIDFSRNFGHQIAVTAGLDHAEGEYVAIIDADLQDPPELISALYNKAQEGFEVVYAKRRSRRGESYLKKFTAKVFYRVLSRFTTVYIPVDTGDFRIIRHNIVKVLRTMPEQQKYLRGQIAWVGYRQTFVEYDRDERSAGETGYTYRKMFKLAIDAITSFSNLPLKFATAAGFVVAGSSFLLMIYALYSRYITKIYQPGWTSLMLVILFIGGIQLICIGIIGEYISRISENVRNRPLYIIGNTNFKANR